MVERLAARIARLIAFHVGTLESRRPLPERPEAGNFVILGRAILESERGSRVTRDAQAYFEKALALDPDSIFALQGLAAIKIDQIRNGWIPWDHRPVALHQAEAAIERIIKLDHRNVGAHWLRGFLLRERGEVDHAIAALEHALSLNPNFSLALAELGRTKIDAGRAREGLQNIEEAIRISPTDPAIHVRYFWAGMAAVHLTWGAGIRKVIYTIHGDKGAIRVEDDDITDAGAPIACLAHARGPLLCADPVNEFTCRTARR